MSDEYRPPPPAPRSGCLTAFMILAGIILLLPGLCALLFGGMALTQQHFESDLLPFIIVGLLVGGLGTVLIRAAFRGPGS
jgi:hypothetical protein